MDDYDYDYDDHESHGERTEARGTQREERAQFIVQSLMPNCDGDIIFVDYQNDVYATISDKLKLTVTLTDSRQPYQRQYTQQVSGLFLDPTGTHIFVGFNSGELEYINLNARKHEKVALSSSVGAQVLGAVPLLGGVAPQQLPAASFTVTAVGWDQTNKSAKTTGWVLLGSREGTVYEVRVELNAENKPQSAVKPLITSGEYAFNEPIRSVCVERMTHLERVFVLISSERRMLRFATDASSSAEKQSLKACLDTRAFDTGSLPSAGEDVNNGRICVYRPNIHAPPVSFAWASPTGIYHGLFTNQREAVEPTTLSQIQFGPALGDNPGGFGSIPRDVTLTAFHMVLTYEDRSVILLAPAGLPWVSSRTSSNNKDAAAGRLQVRASAAGSLHARDSKLSAVDFTERQRCLFYPSRKGKGGRYGVRDVAKRKTYVLTGGTLMEIEVKGEHRSAWRIFLERAVDLKEERGMRDRYFHAAAQIVSQFDKDRVSLVRWLQGTFYAETARYDDATTSFALCDRFEDAFEFLASKTSRRTLIDFMEKRIRVVEDAVGIVQPSATETAQAREVRRARNQPLQLNSQLASLSTATLQLWLERMTIADGENAVKQNDCREQLNKYLTGRVEHVKAVSSVTPRYYDLYHRLIAAHGRTEVLLKFAENMGRLRYTVSHHINNRDYARACDVLIKTCRSKEHANVWYEFAPFLIQRVPCKLMAGMEDFLRRDGDGFSSFLRAELLLPAFVAYQPTYNENEEEEGVHLVIAYLSRALGATSLPVMWNYYVMLCIQHDLHELQKALTKPYACYNRDFVLRKCLESSDPRVHAKCVLLYTQMGLIEEAVRLAVSNKDEKEAKRLVREGDIDDATKKRLWKQIAELVAVNTQRAQEAAGSSTNVSDGNAVPQAVLQVVRESGGFLVLEDVLPVLAKNNTMVSAVKEAICDSLQSYSEAIVKLRQQMDVAAVTAAEIKADETRLRSQFGYITASQRCDHCGRPLLQSMGAKPFVLYPSCSHAFHEDCLNIMFQTCDSRRISDIADEIGLLPEERRTDDMMRRCVRDADCPSCGEFAVAQIADPYFDEFDADQAVWTL